MSYFISINKEESCQHLVKSHNPLCKTPTINLFTSQGIEPLFAAPTTAHINIVGQAPGIKAQESRLYWNDKAVIAYVNGSVWIAIPSIILVCLLSSRWTFITQEKANQGIYHRAKASQKNGIR